MDAAQIIDRLGGTKDVMEMTGLTKGRISQWRSENHIPNTWMRIFRAERPDAFGKPKRRARVRAIRTEARAT